MEPVIRNYRSVYQPGGAAARLISLDDNPATCTMTYSVIEPGKTSAHQWRNETQAPMLRVTFNAVASETHEG